MQIHLELFGPQAQMVGKRAICFEFSGIEPTCAILRARLAYEHPCLADSLSGSRFAVNHQFVQEEQIVCDQDQIALIGMVSGG